MNKIENFKITDVPVWKIVIAATSDPDYEMDRTLLVENYPEFDDYTIVQGSHCSCYDFDDTTWDATTYTSDELKKLAEEWQNSYWSEKIIAPLILGYLA